MSSLDIKEGHAEMRDLRWSPSEKAIARKAFEDARARVAGTVRIVRLSG